MNRKLPSWVLWVIVAIISIVGLSMVIVAYMADNEQQERRQDTYYETYGHRTPGETP